MSLKRILSVNMSELSSYGLLMIQGYIDQPSKTMKEAREHVLETLALDQKTRYPASFEEVRERMKSMLKSSDITQIIWLDSKYYPHIRTAEHSLGCVVRGQVLPLTYEVSMHDDGKVLPSTPTAMTSGIKCLR